VSTHQGQSHLHSQQVNAKSTSSSTRGLPASHSATRRKTYEHRAGSPRNERFSLPHWLYCKPALKTSAKKTYDHPACPSCNGRFKPTSPVVSQTSAQSFRKEDLQASNVSPRNRSLQVHISGSSQAALFRANRCHHVSVLTTAENSGVSM
jgi:hypothetical protein